MKEERYHPNEHMDLWIGKMIARKRRIKQAPVENFIPVEPKKVDRKKRSRMLLTNGRITLNPRAASNRQKTGSNSPAHSKFHIMGREGEPHQPLQ